MASEHDLDRLAYESATHLETHRHSSLWEEEKHYTWWVYVLLGFLVLVVSSNSLEQPLKSTLVFALSLFGVFICLLGFIVIRREGIDLNAAKTAKHEAAVRLGIPDPDPARPANHRLRIIVAKFPKRALGIRDCFQLLLFASAGLFAAFLGYSFPETREFATNLISASDGVFRLAGVFVSLAGTTLVFHWQAAKKES